MAIAVGNACLAQAPSTFVHPGIFSSQAELDSLRIAVSTNNGTPMVAGYNSLASSNYGSLNYTATPYADVLVEPSGWCKEEGAFRQDAHALYIQAIKWVVTGDDRYRDKAIEIADAWASTFETITSTKSDKQQQPTLEASWALPIWIAGAEILKSYNNGISGWDSDEFDTFVRGVLSYVNGSIASAPNWYISRYLSRMAAGVFLEDKTIYNSGYNGVTGQIDDITTAGVIPELSRDFVHSQYVLIGLAQCAEIAYQQADPSLFTRSNARLRVGAEAYVSSVMGLISPNYFSDSDWARKSAPYEILLNRYTKLGMSVPYTRKYVLSLNRPENGSEDHFVGWLTATHAISVEAEESNEVKGNLAYNKTVTASSEPQPENPASSAVDNGLYSRWSASGYPQWLEVDLGSIQRIVRTEVLCYENRAYQFKIEFKADEGDDYELIVDRLNNEQQSSEDAPIEDSFSAVDARYVRITVTGANDYTGTWASITEFRIFGEEGTDVNSLSITEGDFVSVYPNPATATLCIKSSKPIQNVTIFNTVGQIVLKSSAPDELVRDLDISSLKSGIYLYRMLSNDGCIGKGKFVVK